MIQGTRTFTAEELFGDWSKQSCFRDTAIDFERHWEWPEKVGRGYVSLIQPRPGIYLEIGNFQLRDTITIIYEQSSHELFFGFCTQGSMKYCLNSEKSQNKLLEHKQGYSVAGFVPKQRENIVTLSSESPFYHISIAIEPRTLKTLLNDQYRQEAVGLHKKVNDAKEMTILYSTLMSSAVNTTIQQIFHCPYQEQLKKLFLESKALELITFGLAEVTHTRQNLSQRVTSPPKDAERAQKAKNILLRNLDTPPSLMELARKVGTNKTTLNKEFRQLFGVSTFEYLRVQRLEKAKELLDRNNISVNEAATYVGYSHQSSFTRAFKKHFGVYPSKPLY
jgi:AraC-like DNA-binding protein